MKRCSAFDRRTHALALVAVLVVHGGLLYGLWSVRMPARPDEAKILFVSLIDALPVTGHAVSPSPATAAPSRPAAPTQPRAERKTEPVARRPASDVAPEPAPPREFESQPVDDAQTEQTVDAPATSPTEAVGSPTPGPPQGTGEGTDEGAAEDGAGNGLPAPGAGPGAGAGAGRTSGGPVALTSDLALVCAERRAPPYPSVSRRLGEAGRVVLRVELDASGRVVDAQVVESSGFARLDAAALAAVRNWRCTPPQRDGHAVGAVALQPFDFTLGP